MERFNPADGEVHVFDHGSLIEVICWPIVIEWSPAWFRFPYARTYWRPPDLEDAARALGRD